MELKTLILGLAFSLGIFAVKSGAGLGYLLRAEPRFARRMLSLVLFVIGYGLVFACAWLLVERLDFVNHLDGVMTLLQNGMTVHFILALLLLVWGITLLGKGQGYKERSRGWLLLCIPCPVCFSVIFISGAFISNLYPHWPWVFPWLGCGFLLVSVMASLFFYFFDSGGIHGLGSMMVMVSLYFLLTVTIMPHFADAERVYRLSQTVVTGLPLDHLPLLLTSMSVLFTIGLLRTIGIAWK